MIYKYYLEIKNRVLLLFITWCSTICIIYNYKESILFLMMLPSIKVSKTAYLYFIFTNLTDIFYTYMQLSYFIGNQICLIYFFYHIFIYLSPGMYDFEYKKCKFILYLFIFSLVVAVIILTKIFLPITFKFFLSFQELASEKTCNFYFEAKINEFLNFYITLYFISFINCCIFIFIFMFLSSLNGSLLKFIKIFRKYIYIFFFLLSTITTPPDIISQISLGISAIFAYEILILYIIFKNNLIR